MHITPDDHEKEPRNPEEIADAQNDGRNIEWEDRARVNIEPPSKESTNIERDFEPEKKDGDKKDDETAY